MFIYKIWKEDDENFYIGSTKDFHKRKIDHKNNCKNPKLRVYTYKIYQHIRTNGGWGSWCMDIIEECEDRDREIELIKEMKPSLNTFTYDFDGKEWWKKYNEKNFEKLKLHKGKKYSCECGGKYTWSHQARHFRTEKHQKFIQSLHSPLPNTSPA